MFTTSDEHLGGLVRGGPYVGASTIHARRHTVTHRTIEEDLAQDCRRQDRKELGMRAKRVKMGKIDIGYELAING